MAKRTILFLFLVALVGFASALDESITTVSKAKRDSHSFNKFDEVHLRVGKIGPYSNPSETYEFYSLPFCAPADISSDRLNLGEVLEGSRKESSLYDIRFLVDIQFQSLCKPFLTRAELDNFASAVDKKFYIQMFYDDLPMYSMLGEFEEFPAESGNGVMRKLYLYTHLHFSIGYHNDRIVSASVTPDPSRRMEVTPTGGSQPIRVEFSYSAKWTENTAIDFDDRMKNVAERSFFPEAQEVQWLSITNALLLVLLLTGFLALILTRILKKDYQRYNSLARAADQEADDDGDDGNGGLAEQEESGWKLLHGDVFRFPVNKTLFAALIGTGSQLVILCLSVLLLAVVGIIYPYSRGTMFTAIIIIYALTSCIAGYVSATLYRQMGGVSWVRCVLMTVSVFALPAALIWSYVNTVAVAYDSTAALPFGTVCVIALIFILITFPLTLFGAITGKNGKSTFDAPCRTKMAERTIPPAPWYRGAPAHYLIAGFLPFSAIYVELFYILLSYWGHRNYAPFELVLLSFLILIVVTASVAIALTYFQLSMENHKWWWRSLLSGASCATFIFAYCIYFEKYESHMTGTLQLSFFYGYSLLLCYGFALMMGTVSYFASLLFVKRIYKSIKCD